MAINLGGIYGLLDNPRLIECSQGLKIEPHHYLSRYGLLQRIKTKEG